MSCGFNSTEAAEERDNLTARRSQPIGGKVKKGTEGTRLIPHTLTPKIRGRFGSLCALVSININSELASSPTPLPARPAVNKFSSARCSPLARTERNLVNRQTPPLFAAKKPLYTRHKATDLKARVACCHVRVRALVQRLFVWWQVLRCVWQASCATALLNTNFDGQNTELNTAYYRIQVFNSSSRSPRPPG